MYKVPVIAAEGGKKSRELPLPEHVSQHVLYEVVRWQLASRRRGTAATKTRGEVSYSTRKLFPQKGLGRARHGSRGANIYVGGGVVFGPKPRDYGYTLPKKVRRNGLAMALADRAREEKLLVVEKFAGVEGKTKQFVEWAAAQGLDGSERVTLVSADENVRRAARNLPWVITLAPEGVNVYDILRSDWLLLDEAALAVALERAGIGGEA